MVPSQTCIRHPGCLPCHPHPLFCASTAYLTSQGSTLLTSSIPNTWSNSQYNIRANRLLSAHPYIWLAPHPFIRRSPP
ncbi:hypothetical protein B0T20DRAFT_250905 [Sordaria brevicollis]|uniref:Uncharacterized protein n=1 Tax=Sordaria brevicollis TaxID=83679 RepID=A0AAE0UAM7_SORBR|nr:hypothetical protein B0T20DRAFT_250905 [Sordaria brevicollis]